MQYKISEESAQDQVDKLLDTYGVDIDFISKAYPDNAAIIKYRHDMLKNFIMRGFVEISENESGQAIIVQYLSPAINGTEKIEYGVFSAQTNIAKTKDGVAYATQLANTLGALSGLGSSFFSSSSLNALNMKVCDEIFSFFRAEF